MEGEALRQGKERVRLHLINPLRMAGMTRKRTMLEPDYLRFLDSLAARLAYMRADRLQALAEVVERYAEGTRKDRWPSEISILNWARRLQEPPETESRLVRTYLQSAAGDAADAGGYLVEMFQALRENGLPLTRFNFDQIRSDAAANARMIENIVAAQKVGRASPSELAWLDQYMNVRRRCLDIRAAAQKEDAA
jgi:hypothetical protein